MAAEHPIAFDCDGETLRGVLHVPPQGGVRGPGIVFLHGWSGCRLGPHRMFVTAARLLCSRGYPCLRFDFRGRGESTGVTRDSRIRLMVRDARAAIDVLLRESGVADVVLIGICSGAKVGTTAATLDDRVRGLVLWSAEPMGGMRRAGSRWRRSLHVARAYVRKALRPETWKHVVQRKVNVEMVGKAMLQQEAPSRQELREESDVLRAFRRYKGEVLFVYGSNDPISHEAVAGFSAFSRRYGLRAAWHAVEGANHSFYAQSWEQDVLEHTMHWMASAVAVSGAEHKVEDGVDG